MNSFTPLFDKLDLQKRELFKLVQTLPADQFTQRPIPGKWNIAEHLAHLGRYQEIFLQRLQQIMTQPDPALGRYRAEEDPGFADWTQKGTAALTRDIAAGRRIMEERLRQLGPDQWTRKGRHPVFGLMPVSDWLHFFVLHEGHHIYAIFRLSRMMSA